MPATQQAADMGLSNEQRQGVVNILAKFVADEYVLYTKTRK
jgi:DNA-binding ferritin-like protein